ncbi:MAG: prephenate dehydrogenase/arogenate dehydrogenase family protein, partial [Acidimicrobiales bacterium]
MTSRSERRALVVGTGLIGGSLGLALRARGWRVSGWDADEERAKAAVDLGVLDAVGDDPEAEVAFVATPVAAAATLAGALLDRGHRPDLVVTDVAGVKGPVVAQVDHARFVGGHPMAGSELLGLDGADPDLFAGAAWVLTPTPATDLGAFDRLQGVVASLGGDVVVLPPEDHDRLVAVVSHVPHLVAATLVNAATDDAVHDAALLRLAAGGFRDMTRVAAGHPGIWPDVCADNAAAIVVAFDHVLDELSAMRDRVAAGDRVGLLDALARASTARRHLPARGARPELLAELRIPVPDRLGVLDEITGLAAGLGANIYDIEIAHSAESARGVLLLVVADDDGPTLRDAVVARGYHCTVQG